jgi:hypothetical protein
VAVSRDRLACEHWQVFQVVKQSAILQQDTFVCSHNQFTAWNGTYYGLCILTFFSVEFNITSNQSVKSLVNFYCTSGTARCKQRDIKQTSLVSYKLYLVPEKVSTFYSKYNESNSEWNRTVQGFAICGPPICLVRHTYILGILYHSTWRKNSYRLILT